MASNQVNLPEGFDLYTPEMELNDIVDNHISLLSKGQDPMGQPETKEQAVSFFKNNPKLEKSYVKRMNKAKVGEPSKIPDGFEMESKPTIPEGFEIETPKSKLAEGLTKVNSIAEPIADTIVNTVMGYGETVGNLATSFAAMPVTGLAQIAGLIAKGDLNKALEWGETVSDYMTYKPTSRYGKIYTEAINKALGLPSEAIRGYIGEPLTDVFGPAMATSITTPLELATYALLFKKAKGVFPKEFDPAKVSPESMAKADAMVNEFYNKSDPTPSIIQYKEPTIGDKAPMPRQAYMDRGTKREELKGEAGTPLIRDQIAPLKAPAPRSVRQLMIDEARTVLGDESGAINVKALVDSAGKLGKSWNEFWRPMSTIPNSKDQLFNRYKMFGSLDRSEIFVGQIFDDLGKFNDTVKGDIFRYLDGQITSDMLPIEAQNLSKSLRGAIDTVGKMAVDRKIISEEAYNEHKGRYVHLMYARHILGDDVPIGVSPTGKLNLTYAKSRKDLTMDQKKSLGLIEDAQIAVPTGLGKVLTDIAKTDYLNEVAVNPDWTWQPSIVNVPIGGQRPVKMGIGKLVNEVNTYEKLARETPSPEVQQRYNALKTTLDNAMQQTGNIPDGFTKMPDSKSYGSLAGAYIRTPIANDIMPLMESFSGPGGAKLWKTIMDTEAKGMALFKTTKVALNLPTIVRNIVSNIAQNNMRGRNIGQILLEDYPKAAKGMLENEWQYKRARKLGLFKTNWANVEIKDILENVGKAKDGTFSSLIEFGKNIAGYYGKIDDFSKYAIFRQLKEDGFPDREALLEAQKWGMDYSLASRSVKHLRQHIVPFLSYQYKIAPLIVESLAKRPWVIGKYAAVPLAMKLLTQEMNDMTDKDWLDLRKSLPFYVKDHMTYMVVPSKTKNGNYQWMNYNYFVPWGNYLSLFENMANRDIGETVKSLGITNPFLQLPYTFSVARKDRSPVNPYTGQELYNMLDTPANKAAKTVYALATTFIPPMLTKEGALGYTYKAAVGKEDKWGREVTPAQAVGRWFGFNLLETTPKQTYVIKKGMINDVRSNLYRVLTDPSINDKEKEEYKDRARNKISEFVNE